MSLPVAILCGGHGTRAKQPINKCFTSVAGKPFLLHTLEMLEIQGFSTFVLCRGTDGTLADLRKAKDQLGEKFLLLYGDTMLRINYSLFVHDWEKARTPAAMATWDEVDAGVHGLTSWMLDMLDDDYTDFVALRDEARKRMMIHIYESPVPWLEVGTETAIELTRLALS